MSPRLLLSPPSVVCHSGRRHALVTVTEHLQLTNHEGPVNSPSEKSEVKKTVGMNRTKTQPDVLKPGRPARAHRSSRATHKDLRPRTRLTHSRCSIKMHGVNEYKSAPPLPVLGSYGKCIWPSLLKSAFARKANSDPQNERYTKLHLNGRCKCLLTTLETEMWAISFLL